MSIGLKVAELLPSNQLGPREPEISDGVDNSLFRLSIHQLIVLVPSNNESPFVLSFKTELIDMIEYIRAILRTKETNYFYTVPSTLIEEPVTPLKILSSFNCDFRVKSIYPLVFLNVNLIFIELFNEAN